MKNQYQTPEAFKQAVESRIRNQSLEQNRSIVKIRQSLIFDRFLVRVFSEFGAQVLLKGGFALELYLPLFWATRDLDLWMRTAPILQYQKGSKQVPLRIRQIGWVDGSHPQQKSYLFLPCQVSQHTLINHLECSFPLCNLVQRKNGGGSLVNVSANDYLQIMNPKEIERRKWILEG